MKTRMKTAELAGYLSCLANGFRAGRFVLEKDGEHMVLNPEAMTKAKVEIEVRLKHDKSKYSLELSWDLPPEPGAELKISPTLPESAAPGPLGVKPAGA